MAEEWSPATPELGQHFHEADGGVPQEPRRSYSTHMVTIGQFETLENNRREPALEAHLTPGDQTEASVHHGLDARREGEIDYVAERLCSASEEMRGDFKRGDRFERSRNFERAGRGKGIER